jgi:hypothetical protein
MIVTLDTPVITFDELDALDRYGVIRVLVPRFDVDGYHYSKLSDAVAQARRSSSRL